MSKEIELECRDMFNQVVLTWDGIARLIGYAENERDCYYILKFPGNVIQYHSAVGGVISLQLLKGQGIIVSTEGELWNDYHRLDTWLTLNGCEIEDEFKWKAFKND